MLLPGPRCICSFAEDETASSVPPPRIWRTSSAASKPECRATSQVALRLTYSSLTTYAPPYVRPMSKLTALVCSLWHQLPDFYLRIRSHSISARSWHQGITLWGRPCLCLWPEASLCHLQASPKIFLTRTPILCRQAHST